MVKLAVCYPWDSPFVFTECFDSILNLKAPADVEIRYIRGVGWCPSRRHNDLCEKALDWGADLILIIGADQVYPEDMLHKLIEHWRGGCEAVSALVPFRGHVAWQEMKPFQPLGWNLKCEGVREFRGQQQDPDMFVPVDPAAGDLQRVQIIGSGVLMFHRDHLLSLEQPWFADKPEPKTWHRIADMDSRFVWRLQQEAGATLWVDTTINVKHLHIFKVDETFQDRFADWGEPGRGDPDICKEQGEGIASLTAASRATMATAPG